MDETTLAGIEAGHRECLPGGGCQIRAMVDEVRRLRAALTEVVEHTAGYQDIEPAYDAYVAARAALEHVDG